MKKSLPIDLFYLTYEDEKTAREAADMLFSDLDVRNKIIEKAEKRYKIEKKKRKIISKKRMEQEESFEA